MKKQEELSLKTEYCFAPLKRIVRWYWGKPGGVINGQLQQTMETSLDKI